MSRDRSLGHVRTGGCERSDEAGSWAVRETGALAGGCRGSKDTWTGSARHRGPTVSRCPPVTGNHGGAGQKQFTGSATGLREDRRQAWAACGLSRARCALCPREHEPHACLGRSGRGETWRQRQGVATSPRNRP